MVQILQPHTDQRLNSITTEERQQIPVCQSDYNYTTKWEKIQSIVEIVHKSYVKEFQKCSDEKDCPSNMICRTFQCVDPCNVNAASFCQLSSICKTENHQLTCACPNNFKRNPLDLYSRCYNVECFTDDDCKEFIKCNKLSHVCEFTPNSKIQVKEKWFASSAGGAFKVGIGEDNTSISTAPPHYPWYYDPMTCFNLKEKYSVYVDPHVNKIKKHSAPYITYNIKQMIDLKNKALKNIGKQKVQMTDYIT
ncbi:hypothetical protein NQ314_010266 [Rhamnusium bicolor]|uniref:Uncharacterized protein n=1 Tax=Rhamnusium bicolor TaxID=1586634 RepID=A0AAV8XT25_9CUCU|nr:hypothetical protein NQ314_010266 [Rhamnusium bicolor]